MSKKLLSFSSLLSAAYLFIPGAQQADRKSNWWVWLIIILVLVLIVIWLWTSRRKTPAPPPAVKAPEPLQKVEPVVAEAPQQTAQVEEVLPDDLKIIEGIGPKISKLLNDAGIFTFAQLAETDVETLRKLMLAANLRIADPTTWPQQAKLAAAGDMQGLQTLQNSLKGGRVVA